MQLFNVQLEDAPGRCGKLMILARDGLEAYDFVANKGRLVHEVSPQEFARKPNHERSPRTAPRFQELTLG